MTTRLITGSRSRTPLEYTTPGDECFRAQHLITGGMIHSLIYDSTCTNCYLELMAHMRTTSRRRNSGCIYEHEFVTLANETLNTNPSSGLHGRKNSVASSTAKHANAHCKQHRCSTSSIARPPSGNLVTRKPIPKIVSAKPLNDNLSVEVLLILSSASPCV